MKSSLVEIAGIETLTVQSSDPSVAVIFFHGYGANMQDLFPLWEMWHQNDFNWYFPNGVESLPQGYYGGRAWFSIDIQKLEESIKNGTHRDMAGSIPPEFAQTMAKLEVFIKELSVKHKKIILGGFSQGAMLASHLALKPELPISGLVLLSGSLLAETLIPLEARALPFYQSHGDSDPILPVSGAKLLWEKLQSLKFNGKLHVFSGGHEIPGQVLSGVKEFLSQFKA